MTQSNQSVFDFLDGCMCPILKGGNNAIQLVSGHLGAGQRLGSLFQGYERRNPGKASWRSLRRGLLSMQKDTAVQRVRAAQVSLSFSEFLYFIVSMCTSHFVQHSHFYWGRANVMEAPVGEWNSHGPLSDSESRVALHCITPTNGLNNF